MPKKKIIIRRRIPTKTENPVSHLESCLKKEEAHSSSDDVKEKSIKREMEILEGRGGGDGGGEGGGEKSKETESSYMPQLSRKEKLVMWNDFQQMIEKTISKSNTEETDPLKKIAEQEKKSISGVTTTEGMTEICLECMTDSIVEGTSGCYECTNCGVMGGQIIDTGAEWRFYGSEDNKSSDPTRCGMPSNELLPESSLGSVVGYGWKGSDSFEMHRIRKYQGWSAMPYKERARYNDFQIIQNTAARGGLPQCIIEDAKSQYKKITEDQISRGANRKGLRAACVYSACKKYNVPRSDKEIAEIFELEDITIMTRACKLFQQIWNTHQKSTMKDIMMPASRPGDFIQRFCSKLGMSQASVDRANEIANKADEYGIVSDNTPPSIAAGSIYLVVKLDNLNINKREIATACKISEVTICKCYKKLYQYRKHLT